MEIRRFTQPAGSGLRFVVNHSHISFLIEIPTVQEAPPIRYTSIGLVVGDRFLVVLSAEPLPILEDWLQESIQENLLSQGVELPLYRLLQRLVNTYADIVWPVLGAAEQVTDTLNGSGELFTLIRKVRRDAGEILFHLSSQARLLSLLSGGKVPQLPEAHRLYLLDIADQAQNLVERLAAVRDNLLEAVEGYTSIQSNHMNKVMKTLTIVSTIFLPATLIASIYGMNFRIPEYGWRYGYGYSLVLMATIAFVSLFIMKRKGWF